MTEHSSPLPVRASWGGTKGALMPYKSLKDTLIIEGGHPEETLEDLLNILRENPAWDDLLQAVLQRKRGAMCVLSALLATSAEA